MFTMTSSAICSFETSGGPLRCGFSHGLLCFFSDRMNHKRGLIAFQELNKCRNAAASVKCLSVPVQGVSCGSLRHCFLRGGLGAKGIRAIFLSYMIPAGGGCRESWRAAASGCVCYAQPPIVRFQATCRVPGVLLVVCARRSPDGGGSRGALGMICGTVVTLGKPLVAETRARKGVVPWKVTGEGELGWAREVKSRHRL